MKGTMGGRFEGGFSLIEVLIVIVITTVGFLALINLQVGTLHAVGTSRNMMLAINLAEHFIETMKVEALAWNEEGTDLTSNPTAFPHLHRVGSAAVGAGSDWIQAYDSSEADKRVSPLGNDTAGWDPGIAAEIPTTLNRQFCVHYRLVWLIPNYLIRTDVRVMWLRPRANISDYESCATGLEMHTDLANVSSITIPGTVMRNVFAQ